jgi:hypothetical protein
VNVGCWHFSDLTFLYRAVCSSGYSGHHDSAGDHPTPACNATKVTLERAGDRCWLGLGPFAEPIIAVNVISFIMSARRRE